MLYPFILFAVGIDQRLWALHIWIVVFLMNEVIMFLLMIYLNDTDTNRFFTNGVF